MYSIKAVSQITGIPTPTLRSWERRYELVTPRRDDGRRVYGDRELQRLSRIKALVDAGHRISDLAILSDDELNQLQAGPQARSSAVVDRLLDALDKYDLAAIDALLARVMVSGSLEVMIEEVLSPLLRKLGERWQREEMSIAQERLLSSAIRGRLGALIQMMGYAGGQPDIICLTTEGERHELGLAMFAMLAASHGLHVRYLGTELPDSQIRLLSERLQPRVIAVSLVTATEPEQVARALRDQLPDRVELWIGGGAAAPLVDIDIPGVRTAHRAQDMAVLLRSLG